MSSDWDEIKRLAADFQKAQLTSTLQKLSERNCIEIVSLLIQKGIVDIVFTNDGKEYITPDHLEREVLDELAVNGGRVNLVEISKTLNVDLSKVEDVANKIATNKKIHFMLGQLIEEDYILRIAQEINEKLAQKGEMSVSDLTVHFDLPSDFLQQCVLEKYIGKIIRGRQNPSNPRSFFTHAYTQRCKAKMRGALNAIRRPTTLGAIFQQIGIDEKMFYSLLDEIVPLPGVIASKQSNSQYIPHIYAKMQKDWVTTSFKQNGVLDYNSIAKLGITDAKQFIKKQLPNENMVFLERCAVDSKVIDLSLLSALNECSVTTSFVDLSTILPSYMSSEDIEELYQTINSSRSVPQNLSYFNTVVFSSQFLTKILKPCYEMADEKAKLAIESGSYQHHLAEKQSSLNKNDLKDTFDESKVAKRDERRKKASSGKGGGGTQGRETKTKSTKRNQRGGNARNADMDLSDNDDMPKSSNKELELVKLSDIEQLLSKALEEDGLEHLSEEIAARYHKEINQAAHATAKKLLEAVPQTNRRQTHASLQEKINMLVADIRLYEKGLKVFPSDVQTQLLKYVMKSLGNDICNDLTVFLANESNVNVKSVNNLNPDQRKKIAMECEPEYRAALLEVNKALNTTIDEFISATESALKSCGMILRKIDKKKDRTLIIQHREKLCQQLSETDDKPLVLHLAALILFVTITGCILHASGRFVSHILAFIRPTMTDAQNEILMQYHDLVLKLLQLDAESEEYSNVMIQLNSLQMPLKDMVISYEKPGVSKTD